MSLLARTADFPATGDRYRQLFEALQDMVLMTTPSGELLEINPTGVETLGYSGKAQIAGIPMKRHYVNPSDRRRLISLLDHKGSVKGFETRFARKDGREICVWITAYARKDDEGQVAYYEKIIKDVSNRKNWKTNSSRRTASLKDTPRRYGKGKIKLRNRPEIWSRLSPR